MNYQSLEQVPLQDRDLLERLSGYFDSVDARLNRGEGWLIFNASGVRSQRISRYLRTRLNEVVPRWSFLYVPWRDLALTSYLTQVEFQSVEVPRLEGRAKREFDIATRVSRQTMAKSVTVDLLVVNGLHPQHSHEVQYLLETLEARYRDRLATILLTPDEPHELEAGISNSAGIGAAAWEHIKSRLYEKNLIAV